MALLLWVIIGVAYLTWKVNRVSGDVQLIARCVQPSINVPGEEPCSQKLRQLYSPP